MLYKSDRLIKKNIWSILAAASLVVLPVGLAGCNFGGNPADKSQEQQENRNDDDDEDKQNYQRQDNDDDEDDDDKD